MGCILQGRDILCRAKTGSGKTAAYTLPLLQKILVAKEVSRASLIFLLPRSCAQDALHD